MQDQLVSCHLATTNVCWRTLLLKGMPITQAVKETAAEVGPDANFQSELRILMDQG